MKPKKIIDHFVSEVKISFSFLHEELTFSEPEVSLKVDLGFIQIAYRGANVGVEVVLDLRDKAVDCYVVKLIDSKFPDYNLDDSGRRVRQELFAYLVKYHNFRGRVSEKPSGVSFDEAITMDVKGFAQLLKQFGKEILEDNTLLFEH